MILLGDSREALRALPDESVHCCATSPPYWGLRDYGVAGQIGLEPTPEEYVYDLVAIFREVRRALRDDGTLWLVLGDSYAGSWGNQGRKHGRGSQRPINRPMLQTFGGAELHAIDCDMDEDCRCGAQGGGKYPNFGTKTGSLERTPGLKPKDLVGIPWRVAFALQADGWWLRSDVIWHKPNPMPESVRDRPTKAHEFVFLLSKAARYFYDQKAIAEPSRDPDDDRKSRSSNGHKRYPTEEVAGIRSGSATYPVRNARSVWTIATQPFPEAHFATFPPDLAERCIKAGCPGGGTVLDPFFGAGTVGLVAERLGRRWIGVELSPAYAAMSRRRIREDEGAADRAKLEGRAPAPALRTITGPLFDGAGSV